MKVPLSYQVTEFDCGPVSFINAFSFLFDREEISPELVKFIYLITLDCYDMEGNLYRGGTSRESINIIVNFVNKFYDRFYVKCERLVGDRVIFEQIIKCLDEGGCVLIRCYQDCEHYVLITKFKNDYFYIFDPYYLDNSYYDNDSDIFIVNNSPFYNRKVNICRVFSDSMEDFSLGPVLFRECVLINRIN